MRVAAALLLLFSVEVALAQAGPAAPKVVMVAIPSPAPVPPPETGPEEFSATVQLQIDTEGRVADVRIVKSSGDAKFDRALGKYYRRWRVIPAIDPRGQPTTGTLRIAYRKRGAAAPRSDVITSGDSKPGDEARRIGRMSCRDFLWEYDLMQSIAGKRAIDTEEMLRTAFRMYLDQHPKQDADLHRLMWARRPAIDESVESCRKTPARAFWSEVYEPTLTRHFRKGSRPPPKQKPPKKRKPA